MELPSKIKEQIAFKTRRKIEEHMLIVMGKSKNEEHLSQPFQTNNKRFKIAVTFLTGFIGIFKVTNSDSRFYFKKSITDGDDFIQITIPPGACEIEHLDDEIKSYVIDKGHFTEANYPFTIKPNFKTLESIFENVPQGPIISFTFDDTIRNFLGFRETILNQKYNLSHSRVDILSFNNTFLEGDIAQKMIFKRKRSGILHRFPMDNTPGFKVIEKFRGGVPWYIMESKETISSISLK